MSLFFLSLIFISVIPMCLWQHCHSYYQHEKCPVNMLSTDRVTCNNLLISLLSPTWPSSAWQNTLDTFLDVDVCALKDYWGCHLSPQHFSSCNHTALAGRGCTPGGHEGWGSCYPQASPGSFWPAVTLTRWREWSVEFCCIATVDEEACSESPLYHINRSDQVTVP